MNRYQGVLFRLLFGIAALYNIVFATWLWHAPESLFGLIPIAIPFSLVLIKPLSIGIALFAFVYFYAAIRPEKAGTWITLCLLAKIIPPFMVIGFILFLDWPIAILKMMFFNDVVWWIPFLLFIRKRNQQ